MYKILFFTTFFIITLLTIGCGGAPAPNANSTNPANSNAVNGNVNAGIQTTKKEIGPTTNDAPTLGPVVRAYYEALKKKDDALLRSVLSKGMVKQLEADMKAENKAGLAAFASELDRVPEKDIEVRNEKIDGDKGTAELKGGAYVNWSLLGFVKEDGKWKMSNESPEIEGVKSSAPASNTAK
jgi:hypothetical protein